MRDLFVHILFKINEEMVSTQDKALKRRTHLEY